MTTRTDYITALASLVPGDQPVTSAALLLMQQKAVSKAMDAHSKNRPRRLVADVSGTGAFDYALANLTSWQDDFSQIISVEYPVDDADEIADVLDPECWQIYEKTAGKYLRFLEHTPVAPEKFRVIYTARHTCTDAACTVSAGDVEATQSLSAHFLCRMLAAAHALDQDATISADVVSHTTRSQSYKSLAKDYLSEYHDHMGITPGKPKAACAIQDQDVIYSVGYDRLTHPRRQR
jgi:hypothetical protein